MSVFNTGILITKRGFLVNVILFFIFFTLYYIFSVYFLRYALPSAVNHQTIEALFNFIVVITLLLSGYIIQRFNKFHLIYGISVAISIATVFLVFEADEYFRLILIFLTGAFLGIGMLSFLSEFWNSTVAEERGRIAGLIGFASLPLYFILDPIIAESLDFRGTAILIVILSLGILPIMLLKPEETLVTAKERERRNYPEKRTVLLYTVPWIVFSLINVTLAKNISLSISQQVSSSFYLLLIILQIIGVVLGAMGGGMVADLLGRRLSLTFSLTLYGVSSALAGLFTTNEILFFVYVANGLSWGILFTLYTFVIWGDLANKENCVKMYSIGLAIYYSSMAIGLFPMQISQIPLAVSALASCLLIFLSNIPITLAPELLSSDFREKIKLKFHINAVKKFNKKSQNHG